MDLRNVQCSTCYENCRRVRRDAEESCCTTVPSRSMSEASDGNCSHSFYLNTLDQTRDL
jgi:hypothetical protein